MASGSIFEVLQYICFKYTNLSGELTCTYTVLVIQLSTVSVVIMPSIRPFLSAIRRLFNNVYLYRFNLICHSSENMKSEDALC